MKRQFVIAWFMVGCSVALCVFARPFHTGHFVMTLTDNESRPITNATVYVKTLNRTGLTAGAYDGHYTTFSAQTDTNGVADVAFRFLTSHFTWWLETPSHHSEAVGFKSDFLVPEIVKSDYLSINTNTVDGLAKYNELKTLEEAGDYIAYAEKFEPKSVTYVSNVVRKAMSFYPKINPQPMYAYGEMNEMELPGQRTVIETNGYSLVIFPRVSVDLECGALLPPYTGNGYSGKVSDIEIERFYVETNGVKNFYGRMLFNEGCGGYKRKKTSDGSFPTAYTADVDGVYVREFHFHVMEDASTGARISCQQLLDEDEYMVIRTRMSLSQDGETNGWHYAKLLGVINIGDILSFTQSVFNPRLNDTNLEFDVKENLAGSRGQSRWP